jgi:hypothetical protein
MSFATAMMYAGSGESTGWAWMRKSHAAEKAGDKYGKFFFAWPSYAEPDYLHNLVARARARRGEMLTTALLTGDVVIDDGRVVFEPGDFGEVTYDEFGIPIARRPTVRPVRIVTYAPDRELSPASFGTPTKAGRAIMAERAKPIGPYKQMSEMEKELREKLKEAQSNPNRPTAKPNPTLAPVQILGRGGFNDPQERINQPSNETGLTTRKPDAPRAQPAAIDYSRKR